MVESRDAPFFTNQSQILGHEEIRDRNRLSSNRNREFSDTFTDNSDLDLKYIVCQTLKEQGDSHLRD